MHEQRALGATGLVVAALAIAGLATHAVPGQPREALEAAHAVRLRAERAPPPSAALRVLRDGERLDLNTASASALQLLPGIGPALSERIVADREAHGPFANVEALTRVRGIGPRTLARVRNLLRVHSSKTKTTAATTVR